MWLCDFGEAVYEHDGRRWSCVARLGVVAVLGVSGWGWLGLVDVSNIN